MENEQWALLKSAWQAWLSLLVPASPFLNSIAVSRSPVSLSWCRWGRLGLRRDRLGSFALAPSGVGKDLQGVMP